MKSRLYLIVVGAVLLGGVGFVCGFLGPIALNPDANQGPLLGIFITGPGGAVFGCLLGLLLAVFPAQSRTVPFAVLGTVCAVYAAGILYFCIPEPAYLTELVQLEILDCIPPAAERDKAFQRWESSISKVTWAEPRADWKESFDRAASEPGAVLVTRVERRRELFEERKFWKRGEIVAGPWTTAADQRAARPGEYFSHASCDAWPAGTHGVFTMTSEPANGWPPASLPTFLGLRVLQEVPATHSGYAQ